MASIASLDTPRLVRVEREPVLGPDRVADEARAAEVAFEIPADLQLQVREAVGQRLARALRQRVLGIAEPPGRRRVGREAVGEEQLLALRLRRLVATKDRERLVRREGVLDVAEVDARDDLLGRHVGEQLPDRLALELRVEVPDGVDDRRGREMDHALLRPEPAELAVGDEPAPQTSEVRDELLDGRADDVRRKGLDRGDADLGASADREGQAVPREPGIVGLERDVRGRVVGIGVHRVRAGAAPRGREAHVVRDRAHDAERHSGCFYNRDPMSVKGIAFSPPIEAK